MNYQKIDPRNCVKTNRYAKNTWRKFSLLIFLLIFLSISFSAVNPYYYTLMVLKHLIIISCIYFLLISLCGDRSYYDIWNDKNTRVVLFNKSIKTVFLQTIKVLMFMGIFFIFIRYILNISIENLSNIIPSTPDLLLMIVSISLSFIATFTVPYWFGARFLQIVGYVEKNHFLKSNLRKAISGFTIVAIFYFILSGLGDLIYVNIIFGKDLGGLSYLESIPTHLLFFQVFLLILIVISTHYDGRRQVKKRNDFVFVLDRFR